MYVAEEYPVVAPAINTAVDGWKGFIYMAHAVIDVAAAWQEVNSLWVPNIFIYNLKTFQVIDVLSKLAG